MQEGSIFTTPSPAFIVCRFILPTVRWYLIVVLICISEESWAQKNWCFWTVVLEKTLESSLGCKEIQPVHSKGDQPWDFFRKNDAKAETSVLWPPHAKSWVIGKDFDAGRDGGLEEKGTTEDEMAGWHHWLDGREFEWTSGDGDGQGGLGCCDSWGRRESDVTERLNWKNYKTLGLEGVCELIILALFYVRLLCNLRRQDFITLSLNLYKNEQ